MSSKPRPLSSRRLDGSIRLLGRRERSEPGLQADEVRRIPDRLQRVSGSAPERNYADLVSISMSKIHNVIKRVARVINGEKDFISSEFRIVIVGTGNT